MAAADVDDADALYPLPTAYRYSTPRKEKNGTLIGGQGA